MKNSKFQRLVDSAKANLKTRTFHSRLIDGVNVTHLYDEDPKTISFWDDFGFRLGSQWVAVWWKHPRLELSDIISTMAHDAVERIRDPAIDVENFMERSFIPIHEPVGNSRKKVKFYEWKPDDSFKDYNEKVSAVKKMLTEQDGLYTVPHLKIHQYVWGRGVNLCYPVELLSQADVVTFAHKVKAHLKHDDDIFAGLEDYKYNMADYRRDVPESDKVLDHQLA